MNTKVNIELCFQIGLFCPHDFIFSLKWYRDGEEFYSYIPRLEQNPKRFFPLEGIELDVRKSILIVALLILPSVAALSLFVCSFFFYRYLPRFFVTSFHFL